MAQYMISSPIPGNYGKLPFTHKAPRMRPRLQISTEESEALSIPRASSSTQQNSSDNDVSKKWWYQTMKWQNTQEGGSNSGAGQLHYQHKKNAFATRSEEVRKCFSEVIVDVPRLMEQPTEDTKFSADIRKSKRQKSVDLTAQELEEITRFGRQVDRDLISQPVGVCTSQGPCLHMEDRYTVLGDLLDTANKPVSYFGCFDGHGGSSASEFCMKRLDTHLKEAFNGCPCKCSSNRHICACKEKCFHQAFYAADAAFVEQNRERSGRETLVGSTALVAVVTSEQEYWIANVGDSRAVLVHVDGSTTQLTTDHKPNLPSEKTRIEALGGQIKEDRVEGILSMSRAIGNSYLKRYVIAAPQVVQHKIRTEDAFLILGSDGLWDYVSNQHAGRIAKCAKNAQGAAQSLVRAALDVPAIDKDHDNLTAIVIDLR